MPTSEEVFGAFTTVWAELDGDLRSALTQVSAAREEASPTAPGMRSVVAHLEFRDGARFRLRYSFDARDAFLSVEDDVGLHFGFLDDINAYLLDVDFNQPIPSVLTTALAKCVKMHHRASSMSRPASSSGAGAGAGAGAARAAGGAAAVAGGIPLDFQGGMMMYTGSRKQSTRSAAYRIEDHPLAAILAAQQPAQRMRALQAMARPPGGVDGAPAALPLPVGAELDVVNGAAGAGAEAKNGDRKRGVEINFGSSRHATTALMAQVRLLQKQNTRADGFLAQPRDDDLYTWDVSLYFDDPSTALYRDLSKIPEVNHLSLEFKFPSSFPVEPPVVRFLSPVIVGGHVTGHGALCMELLSAAGWTPVNSIDAVCIQIRALLIAGNARIDMQRPLSTERYTLEGAIRDLSSIVFSHGWTVDNARVAKVPRKNPA